jgi:hypothetical protein
MRMQKRSRRWVVAIGIAMLLSLLAETAVAEQPAARATTAVGDVTTDDNRPLAVRSSISDEEKIALEKEEGCSVLIDDEALVVSPLEQIRMKPGDAPPEKPKKLEPEEFAELGGCLVDFHALAGKLASDDFRIRTADRIATAEAAETPWDPRQPPGAPALDPADDIVDPTEIGSPSDCGIGEIDEPQQPVRGNLTNLTDG